MSRPIAECKYCEDDGFITSDFGGMTVQSAPCPKCRHTEFMHWYAEDSQRNRDIPSTDPLLGKVVNVKGQGVGMVHRFVSANRVAVEFVSVDDLGNLQTSEGTYVASGLKVIPMKITKKGSVKRIITVIGRKWFSKMCGNTYHSVTVYVDGLCVGRIPYRYGYGSQYEETALELLQQKGYYTDTTENMLCTVVRKEGDILNSECTQVTRKKDL